MLSQPPLCFRRGLRRSFKGTPQRNTSQPEPGVGTLTPRTQRLVRNPYQVGQLERSNGQRDQETAAWKDYSNYDHGGGKPQKHFKSSILKYRIST